MVDFKKLKKQELVKYCQELFVAKTYKDKYESLKQKLDVAVSDKEKLLMQVSNWQNNKTLILNNEKYKIENEKDKVILRLLDFLDLLENILKLDIPQDYKKNIELVINKTILDWNLTPIDNTKLDTQLHEILIKKDKGLNITEVYQKGYYRNSKILRCSKVVLD